MVVSTQMRSAGAGRFTRFFTAAVTMLVALPAFAQLDEIVITAQKREELFTDAPVAVSVATGATLAARNYVQISDLNKIMPSVNLTEFISGRTPSAIRGISAVSNQQSIGVSSGVLMIADGIAYPAISFAPANFSDVERVEVLKGPQSTLGGRVASSGVVNIVSRGPTDTFTGDVSALLTDDNEYNVSAFFAGPFSDNVGASLAVWSRETERLMKRIDTGKNSTIETSGARAKLRFGNGDSFEGTVSVRYQEMTNDGSVLVYKYIDPNAVFLPFAAGGLTQAEAVPGLNALDNENIYYHDARSDSRLLDSDVFDAYLELNWDLPNGATLTSLTSTLDEDRVTWQNLFIVDEFYTQTLLEGWIPIYNIMTAAGYGQYVTDVQNFNNEQTATYEIKQFTQELKIVSPSSDKFEYVAGVFYSDGETNLHFERFLWLNPQDIYVTSTIEHLGVYGRGTFKITPKFDVLVGARYNRDTVGHVNDQLMYGMFDPANPGSLTFYDKGEDTQTTTVGDLTLRAYPTEDIMVYGTYAKGYKPHAYDTGAQITAATFPLEPVPPEDVDHLELGMKANFAGNKVGLNVAVFDTVYKEFQAQTFFGESVPRPLVLRSVGEAETVGVEIDLTYAPSDTLELGIAAAFVNAEWNDYADGPCYAGQPALEPTVCFIQDPVNDSTATQRLTGKPMPYAPDTKYNIWLDKIVELGAVDLVFGGNYSYSSDFYIEPNLNPHLKQEAFGILDLRVGIAGKDGNWDVTAFANNVTDEFYATFGADFFTGLWGGAELAMYQPARDAHRYFGVRGNFRFGD